MEEIQLEDCYYTPYRLFRHSRPPPAYALLADLQYTTQHLNQDGENNKRDVKPTETRDSISSDTNKAEEMSSYSARTVTTETVEYSTEDDTNSPIYQNQKIMKQQLRKTTSTSSGEYPEFRENKNLSNNLSELDTLLDDLNSARYNSDKKPSTTVNGSSPASPHRRSTSPGRQSASNINPAVDNLLDELQDSVTGSRSPIEKRKAQKSVASNVTITSQNRQATPPSLSSTVPPTASSATQELDDLMASLSDFKVNSSQAESNYAKPQKAKPNPSSQLDSMLGTLQSDMDKEGVKTTAKGHCGACNKPIVGQVVTALGKTWHPEHFTCAHCNQELGTKNFFEREGQPYCETDYHSIFSPRCAYCNGPILDKCVTALDKTWHPEHFFCAQCGKQFGDDGFHEKDGKPYCKDDYFDMFAPKCGGCNRPIMENYISALNGQWHPECFVCRDCRQSFDGGSFYDHEGMPYCETHYHAKRGSLCAGCHKPITGRCITAMFRKFHPEHFVCSFCLKQLNKGTFKEQNDKPYCHPCFEKLFG